MGNFNIKIELDRIPGAKIMDIKKIAPKKEEVKDEDNW